MLLLSRAYDRMIIRPIAEQRQVTHRLGIPTPSNHHKFVVSTTVLLLKLYCSTVNSNVVVSETATLKVVIKCQENLKCAAPRK